MYMKKKMTAEVKSEELVDYTITLTNNQKYFPKRRQFTFVNRMKNLAINIYSDIIEANEIPISEKKKLQDKVLSDVRRLEGLIELSYNRNFIDARQCKHWGTLCSDVKNLTYAWKNKTK